MDGNDGVQHCIHTIFFTECAGRPEEILHPLSPLHYSGDDADPLLAWRPHNAHDGAEKAAEPRHSNCLHGDRWIHPRIPLLHARGLHRNGSNSFHCEQTKVQLHVTRAEFRGRAAGT